VFLLGAFAARGSVSWMDCARDSGYDDRDSEQAIEWVNVRESVVPMELLVPYREMHWWFGWLRVLFWVLHQLQRGGWRI
jgi:hypothetical protein